MSLSINYDEVIVQNKNYFTKNFGIQKLYFSVKIIAMWSGVHMYVI